MSDTYTHAAGNTSKSTETMAEGAAGGDSGCAIVLGWCVLIRVGIFVLMWIIEHLVIILSILLGLAVTAGIIWALYTFREQIWRLLCKCHFLIDTSVPYVLQIRLECPLFCCSNMP